MTDDPRTARDHAHVHLSRRSAIGLSFGALTGAALLGACGGGSTSTTGSTAVGTSTGAAGTGTGTAGAGSAYLGSYVLDNEKFGTQVTTTVEGSTRTISTNALPNTRTGSFPNAGNPNAISEQDNTYTFTTEPTFVGDATPVRTTGVAINGVKFEPGTAETVTCDSGEVYRVEAVQDVFDLGLDFNNAHVQPDGEYHYHGVSELMVDVVDTGEDLVHVGFAADGFLMYYSRSGAYAPGYVLSTEPRTGTGCVGSSALGGEPVDDLEGTIAGRDLHLRLRLRPLGRRPRRVQRDHDRRRVRLPDHRLLPLRRPVPQRRGRARRVGARPPETFPDDPHPGDRRAAPDRAVVGGGTRCQTRLMDRVHGGLLVAVSSALVLVVTGCTADDPAPPRAGPSLTAARAAHTATPLTDGQVLLAGGCIVDGCTEATTSAVLLRADGDSGTAAMNVARDAHTATLLETGDVLVTGGFSAEGTPPLASAEVFDSGGRSWSLTRPLSLGRGGHAAARLGDGRVVVSGGWTGPRQYTATSEIYDPATEAFDAGPRLPEPVDGLSAASLPDGSVLVTGGQVSPGHATATAVVVSPDGTSTEVGPLLQARFKHTSVTLPSGRVLVIGGTSNDTDLLATTELYDPRTRRFTAGPTMSAGRYKLTDSATVVPDGRVVVAGGGPGVEVIDVARGTSTAVAGSGSVPSSFSTTSLVGATVRVVGGYDRSLRLTRTDQSIALTALHR